MAIIIAVHHNLADYVGTTVLALLEAEAAFHCLATALILRILALLPIRIPPGRKRSAPVTP
jgi:hypothetical protein